MMMKWNYCDIVVHIKGENKLYQESCSLGIKECFY